MKRTTLICIKNLRSKGITRGNEYVLTKYDKTKNLVSFVNNFNGIETCERTYFTLKPTEIDNSKWFPTNHEKIIFTCVNSKRVFGITKGRDYELLYITRNEVTGKDSYHFLGDLNKNHKYNSIYFKLKSGDITKAVIRSKVQPSSTMSILPIIKRKYIKKINGDASKTDFMKPVEQEEVDTFFQYNLTGEETDSEYHGIDNDAKTDSNIQPFYEDDLIIVQYDLLEKEELEHNKRCDFLNSLDTNILAKQEALKSDIIERDNMRQEIIEDETKLIARRNAIDTYKKSRDEFLKICRG